MNCYRNGVLVGAAVLLVSLTGCAGSSASQEPDLTPAIGANSATPTADVAAEEPTQQPAMLDACSLIDTSIFEGVAGATLSVDTDLSRPPLGCVYMYPDQRQGGLLSFGVLVSNEENFIRDAAYPGLIGIDTPSAAILYSLYYPEDLSAAFHDVGLTEPYESHPIAGFSCFADDRYGIRSCIVDGAILTFSTQYPDPMMNDALMESMIANYQAST
jgi:hypothetical protein